MCLGDLNQKSTSETRYQVLMDVFEWKYAYDYRNRDTGVFNILLAPGLKRGTILGEIGQSGRKFSMYVLLLIEIIS